MSTIKYSRQREAIKNYLGSVHSHPTAETVYTEVRKEFPSISLGTVYRNLNLLSDMGDVVKITTPDGGDRFDGDLYPHYHVSCKCCKRLFDLEFPEVAMKDINRLAAELFGGEIESHELLFSGVCEECLEKERKGMN